MQAKKGEFQMYFAKRLKMIVFISILAGLFTIQPLQAATHIIQPEDNSVYLDQRDPDDNFVNKSGLMVVSESNENVRAVMHFDLSAWSADSISQAKLYLYHYRGGNYSGSRTINVYALTKGFDESTATWNFPWSVPGGDYDAGVVSSAGVPEDWENWVAWDVTTLLKSRWNQVVNYGFLLKDPAEDTPTDGPYVRFYSHRGDSLPYLEVTTTEQELSSLTEWGRIVFVLVLFGFMAIVLFMKKRLQSDAIRN
jgi:hypothetical protein